MAVVGRLVTPRLVLRRACVADRPALAAVFASNRRFVAATWGDILGPFTIADAARYLAVETARENGTCLALVERAKGDVVGTVALLLPNPADGVPWIGILVLRSDRQGRGLGREAVTALEDALARAGWPQVRLAVRVADAPARRFWEAVGYRAVPDMTRPYDGRERATITLCHALTGAARRSAA
jgi:RimJ/RimL family protein N-acetyltransferase